MLVIDNQMLNLARMQEAVLRKSIDNKETNLEKYKNTVIEIDAEAFASVLAELEQINEHNQTLEDELQFLEQVRDSYNQLFELQLSFKRVCELVGDNSLKLSDLSQINIEYIENRINTINGYLINLKNMSINKNRLEELNIELIEEEKKKKYLNNKMLEFDQSLIKQFVDAEGRIIVEGKPVPTGVILEYQKLGFDFERLLQSANEVDKLLEISAADNNEIEDKLQTAEICYNTAPNKESKQVYDEIMMEYLNFKYKLTMLKMLKLLVSDCDNYDIFREKREKILDLMKYRMSCLTKLGVKFSIDPFDRIKIDEQFRLMSTFIDNSNNVNRIKREIVKLSELVERMEAQNNDYMLQLKNNEDLVFSRTGINDIDISGVSFDISEYFEEEEDAVLDNQVVEVSDISEYFNLERARQKANLVVIRVNDMHNQPLLRDTNVRKEISPELVIVSKPVVLENKDIDNVASDELYIPSEVSDNEFIESYFEDSEDLDIFNEVEEVDKKDILDDVEFKKSDLDIFETVTPFEETTMFVDRTDDFVESEDIEVSDSLSIKELEEIANKKETNLELLYDIEHEVNDEMPDAFWVTQENEVSNVNIDLVPSFDEQISALLNSDNNDFEDNNKKVKKLEIVKNDGLKRVA